MRLVALIRCSSIVALLAVAACGARGNEPAQGPADEAAGQATPSAPVVAAPIATAHTPGAGPEPNPGAAPADGACPADMALVDTVHCPDSQEYPVKLRCLDHEYNKPNHLVICNEFAPGQQCRLPLRRQRFCIDRYEYPNVEGGHPPVMVSAFDAAALCAEKGKRLCWQSEWTAACEGPDKLPFPYGLKRSSAMCNIDNQYVNPSLENVYHRDPKIQGRELRKLDQSKPSGAMAGCKSGFGVHDLTGNFDEWVLTEQARGKGEWAGLKGGAWGHVRNACRPMTTSHPPEFTYYFISFRCCRSPDDGSDAVRGAGGAAPLWTPPPAPTPKPPGGRTTRGWTPT